MVVSQVFRNPEVQPKSLYSALVVVLLVAVEVVFAALQVVSTVIVRLEELSLYWSSTREWTQRAMRRKRGV